MDDIKNDRDKLLQAASVRVEPIPIPIGQIEGLPEFIEDTENSLEFLGKEVSHVMNNTRDLVIRADSASITPTQTVTLTLVRKSGTSGSVTWSVFAGTGTLSASGDTCTIDGASVSSASVTVKAVVGAKEAYATISRFGALAKQDAVNLASQITGQLAMGNVSGYGALALLNSVNLNTQTTGALNGITQVTNLGNLAYANAVAANQIGAGQLAAGVVYAGTINVDQLIGSNISGKNIISGSQIILQGTDSSAPVFMLANTGAAGDATVRLRGSIEMHNGSPSGVYGSFSVAPSAGALVAGKIRLYAYPGTPTITIDGSDFDGNLGAKILLRGVEYTATIGSETKTFKIS